MATLNISLPESLKSFVETQVNDGPLQDASEYLQALLRAEMKRKAKAELEAKLLAGIQGPQLEINKEYWTKKLARLERRGKTKSPGLWAPEGKWI